MSAHPAISINVVSVTNNAVDTAKINAIYIVGRATTGTIAPNAIAQINTAADFDTLIGVDVPSRPEYNFIRKIDSSVPIYFVNGRDVAVGAGLSEHLIAGFALLSRSIRMQPGIVVCPAIKSADITPAQANAIFSVAQGFVSNQLVNWQYFHNCQPAVDTFDKAIANRNNFTSPQGHSALFYGFGRDENNELISLASVAAALLTSLNRRVGYLSPSAYQQQIPFATVEAKYLPLFTVSSNEYRLLNDKNINSIYLDGDGLTTGVYTLYGARTLSADNAWLHINTRYAANNVFNRCVDILKPFLFLPADINAVNNENTASGFQESLNNADIVLALRDLMDTMQTEGAFATPPLVDGIPVGEPYEIRPSKAPNGDLNLEIFMSLVQTRERISLNFVKRG